MLWVAGAATLLTTSCNPLKKPGAPKMEENKVDNIQKVFWWYAPTGVSKNPLIDKTQSFYMALQGNTTQNILNTSATDQINNNEPEDGVWWTNGDTYVTCKTNSELLGQNTITIAARNIENEKGELVDGTWHISFNDDTITITSNGREVRGNDKTKDEFIKKLLKDLQSHIVE
jgi:hypothetical protein